MQSGAFLGATLASSCSVNRHNLTPSGIQDLERATRVSPCIRVLAIRRKSPDKNQYWRMQSQRVGVTELARAARDLVTHI